MYVCIRVCAPMLPKSHQEFLIGDGLWPLHLESGMPRLIATQSMRFKLTVGDWKLETDVQKWHGDSEILRMWNIPKHGSTVRLLVTVD